MQSQGKRYSFYNVNCYLKKNVGSRIAKNVSTRNLHISITLCIKVDLLIFLVFQFLCCLTYVQFLWIAPSVFSNVHLQCLTSHIHSSKYKSFRIHFFFYSLLLIFIKYSLPHCPFHQTSLVDHRRLWHGMLTRFFKKKILLSVYIFIFNKISLFLNYFTSFSLFVSIQYI